MCSNSHVVKQIIDHKITPWIAGYDVKKLLHRFPTKFPVCLNAITHGYGHTLNKSNKNRIPYHTSCMNLRDEGCLGHPSRIITTIAGIIINSFERILNTAELINYYHKSCSSSRVAVWVRIIQSCLVPLRVFSLRYPNNLEYLHDMCLN